MKVIWTLRILTLVIVGYMLYLPHSTYAQREWNMRDVTSANCIYDFAGDDATASPWSSVSSECNGKTLTGVNSPTTTTETLVQGHKALTFNGTSQYGTVNTTTLIRSLYLVAKVNADTFTSTARCAWAQSGGTGPSNFRAIQGCPEGGVSVNKAGGNVWLPSDSVHADAPSATFVQGNSTFGIQRYNVNTVSAGNYNFEIAVNGVVAGTSSTQAGTLPVPTNTYIGANVFQGATVNWCNCDIVRVVAFDAVLSVADDKAVMNLLQYKYFPGMSSQDQCYFIGFDSAHVDFIETQSSPDCKATWTRRSVAQAMVGPSIGTYAGQLRDLDMALGKDGNYHAVATNCQNAKQNLCFSVLTSSGPAGVMQYQQSVAPIASADSAPALWAPQYFVDTPHPTQQPYVFYSWQPTFGADSSAQHFTTYVVQPTNDAQTTWGSATQLTLTSAPCSYYIDAFVWMVDTDYYLGLVADGCGANQIDVFKATSFPTAWTFQRSLGFSNVYYEGPSVLRLSDGQYIMYLDKAVRASNNEYWYATSANGTFSDVTATTAMFTGATVYPNYTTGALQHGTVLKITGLGSGMAVVKPQPWNAWQALWARR